MVTLSVGRLAYWLQQTNKPTNQHTNQPLFVGHNRPYDQPFSSGLIIELKSKYYAVISGHWKFMFKRIFRVSECADACICTKRAREKSTVMIIFRVSECVDACIYTKRAGEKSMVMIIFRVSECVDACIYTKWAREKSTKLTKLASCVLGHPKCFRRPKITCRHPTLQSRRGLASSNLDIGLYGNKKYRYIYVLNHK